MQPISLQSILTDRQLLKYPEVFGSLDRGCSLTKLLYVKAIPDEPAKVSLELAIFANGHFDQALDWLVARAGEEGAFGAVGRKFHVTGAGGDKYRSTVHEKLGMEVVFVDEFMCQQTGAHFLLSNFDDDEFCYAEHNAVGGQVPELPDWMASMVRRTDQLFAETDGQRLPVIFGFCGSATGFNKLNADGSTDILGVSWFAGKSFLGLSQVLLGTNNYDEIMELAARGDRRGVDTQAKEMLAQDEKSEYRMIPPDAPLFPFGKASEGKGNDYSREDLAAAVVGSMTSNMLQQIVTYCKYNRVRRTYLGGHFFRAKVARDILIEFATASPLIRHLKIKFLSNGHTGCIGAVQISAADTLMWRSRMSQQTQQTQQSKPESSGQDYS